MKKSSNDSPRKKGDNIIFEDIPQGLNSALARNPAAMNYFSGLPDTKRKDLINQTHSFTSKQQMRQFVDSMLPQTEY